MMAALLGINDSLQRLLACTHERLVLLGRPVCVSAATVGQPVIASCCECTTGVSGELWGGLLRLYRGDRTTGTDAQARKPCVPVTWWAQYQITLARCFPVLDEQGELPDATERSNAARDLHADAAAIQQAIHCCDLPEPAYLESINVQSDPTGGCSLLVATVRVPVSTSAGRNSYAE